MTLPIRACLRFAACLYVATAAAQPAVRPQPLKSGVEFTGPQVRALQQDDIANPGMLWVERGAQLWNEAAGPAGESCAACHGDAKSSMRGVATRYPLLDPGSARLLDLQGRIRQCRELRQRGEPLRYESNELLALTAFVATQSRGMPMDVSVDWQVRRHFEAGRALFYRRMGQMNLACAQCHQDNWGKRLGPETISQGHGVAYPIYRLEWQTMGSLQRRFRSCLSAVRAEMLPYGAPEYLDLELFLAWRSKGMPLETPGVRR